jgi:hypothetical protein
MNWCIMDINNYQQRATQCAMVTKFGALWVAFFLVVRGTSREDEARRGESEASGRG